MSALRIRQRDRSLKLARKEAKALTWNGIRVAYLSDADRVIIPNTRSFLRLAGSTDNLASVMRLIFPSTETALMAREDPRVDLVAM